jgi:DNA-binding MarR family transcriptional regulator
MTSQLLRALEKRGLLKRSQKEDDERSKFSDLTDEGLRKIQIAAKDLLKAEDSFFTSLGKNKQGFDEYLEKILQQQTSDTA